MIAQVRVADYNMDRCTLALTLPPDPSSDATLASQNRTLRILPSSGRITLDVWALESSGTEIDLTTLCGRTRPQRTQRLGRIVGEFGEERRMIGADENETFECGGTGALGTFEVACAEDVGSDEECELEFWQEQPETVPRMGACFLPPLLPWHPTAKLSLIFSPNLILFPRSHYGHPASINLEPRVLLYSYALYIFHLPAMYTCTPCTNNLSVSLPVLVFHLALHSK